MRELSLYFHHPSRETDTTVCAIRYNVSRKKAPDDILALPFVTPFLRYTRSRELIPDIMAYRLIGESTTKIFAMMSVIANNVQVLRSEIYT